ncbi:hypothetical protein BDN72DRAFT_847850 [Pluteus cervinus]|uniref:Uncharacterized protein n=1 Tax=Pluteus cervinus TaxID=181527 RepID=A0ACD3AED0_9AGAR|nr:hypothetical protein BDN72DRAFT_847850 [Pluteus cervinus]
MALILGIRRRADWIGSAREIAVRTERLEMLGQWDMYWAKTDSTLGWKGGTERDKDRMREPWV